APRLVVAVVYDQLSTHAMARIEPLLDPEGALRWTGRVGSRVERLRYGHAATYTATGHATLFTGVHPRVHGIPSNVVWSRAAGRVAQAVEDGEHRVLGAAPDRTAGPAMLAVPGVADLLEAATGGAARTAAVSLKDRGAILPAGRRPDLAVWLEDGRFTTSRYVSATLPRWLGAFEARRRGTPPPGPWELALDPERAAALLGPDDRPGELDLPGFRRTFPHDPTALGEHALGRVLSLLPQTSLELVELARATLCALEMGRDAVPDLLVVSVSGTDYTGHAFGPGSWEFADHLLRADAAVGRLLRRLAQRIPLGVVVTSDHGVAPLPEIPRPSGPDFDLYEGRWRPMRVPGDALVAAAETALAGDRGTPTGGDAWVAGFASPYIVLADEAFPDDPGGTSRRRAQDRAGAAVAEVPGVHAVFAIDQEGAIRRVGSPARATGSPGPDAGELEGEAPLAALVEASVPAVAGRRPPGDLYVVTEPGAFFGLGIGGVGTSHGTPWRYDRDVPAHVVGPGIPAGVVLDVPQDARRVAATLAGLLGIESPSPEPPLVFRAGR
ncbi:MAG TPA: alkaline phosphatase family protein, partial [Polyangiaceae bacterium LLY-WYZ-14_1]|nr:alkaline phosphatase family protein [Polyangiaceae bacterium LLY-WYZ-14_1]